MLPVISDPLTILTSSLPRPSFSLEIDRLRDESVKYHRQVAQLNTQLHTAFANEQKLKTTLAHLAEIIAALEENASRKQEEAFHEDKLLSKIELMEKQLNFYITRSAGIAGNPEECVSDDSAKLQELKNELQRVC